MVTYLMRHARTELSAGYIVNGRPETGVSIDRDGLAQCEAARTGAPWDEIKTCVVSRFARTAQTATAILGGRRVPTHVEPRLDELDYGHFEAGPFLTYGRWLESNGPWARPPGAAESQREAILRMLAGLWSVLSRPAPRLVVAHGLLVSVLRHGNVDRSFFPEAPYVTPLRLTDDELIELTIVVGDDIVRERGNRTLTGGTAVSAPEADGGLATFGHGPVRPQKEDRHA